MPRVRPLFALLPLLVCLSVFLPDCHRSLGDATLVEACTAGLSLLEVEPQPFDPQAGRASLLLRFDAPPDPDSLADNIRVRLDGAPVDVELQRVVDQPKVVTVHVPVDPGAWADAVVASARVELRRGVTCEGAPDVEAAPTSRAVTLVTDPAPVVVQAVVVHEGAEGHYLEVLCRDYALGETHSRWTDDGRVEVSERCMPDLSASEELVRTEPALALELIPTRGGFLVYGPFEQGDLELIIQAGTPTLDGGSFRRALQQTLAIPAMQPRLSFLAQGRYLPRNALSRLGIRHRNVPAARLQVRHVPKDNLLFWMTGSETASGRTSDLVLERELSLSSDPDSSAVTWIELGASLPDASEGLYEVSVYGRDADPGEADDDTGLAGPSYGEWNKYRQARAAVRVLLTDLQLVAKRSERPAGDDQGGDDLLVWVLDTHGRGPQQGVRVELVRRSGKVLGGCLTDAAGGCRIHASPDPVDPEPAFALVARRGSDLTMLALEDLELEARGDVQGEPFLAAASIRAAAWTDRGVYRPGDAVHLAALLRGDDDRAPAAGLPVALRWVDSGGRELRRDTASSDAAGMVEQTLSLRDFARTGRYHAVLELADREIGRASFMVEEIAPERMDVDLAATAAGLLPDQAAAVALDARWLFGSPAAGSRVELSCSLEQADFAPAHNGQLHYGPARLPGARWWAEDLARVEATLDADGHNELSCPAASSVGTLPGSARLRVRADVFEGATGRSSKGWLSLPVHPDRRYLGLQADRTRARPGEPVHIQGLVVDWNGRPLTGEEEPVQVEVLRLEHESSWTWDEGSQEFHYGGWVRRASEQQVELRPQQGALSFDFTPSEAAWGYLVVARAGDARTELLLEGERYRWGESGLNHTPGPSSPGWLELQAPEQARVGDRVPVSVKVPRAGWLLLTAETWQVTEHRWLRVQPGEARWSFPVRDFAPNVYVSALLVQDPHQLSRDSYLPGRSQGTRSVRVLPERFQAELTLGLPDEVAPEGMLEVEVELRGVKGPASVVVAAVDEGLLSLTGHPVPDPLGALFGKRALGVSTYETVGWTLELPSQAAVSSPGGDAAMGKGRVQAIVPVALWSGVVQLPASGRATVRLAVPGYHGALRVVAVAASADRVAVGHGSVPVREPLLLQASPPRFLVAGDLVQIPVAVSNLTDAPRQVRVRLVVESLEDNSLDELAVRASGPWEQRLTLAPGARGSVRFPVLAEAGRGAVRLRFEADSGELSSHESVDLPLMAPLPTEHEVQVVALEPGRAELSPLLTGWVEGSDLTEVHVTASPYADALAKLEDLLHYPHGCLEQTSSQLHVLLALGPMLEQIAPDLVARRPVDAWVRQGIDRLQRLQTYSGGFAYWPGSSTPSPWASAYALHVLMTARDQGHAVPEQTIAEGLDYLERLLDAKPSTATAYAHYVLALAGRGQPAQARAQLHSIRGDREARYQLMAAVYLAGDHRYQDELADLSGFVTGLQGTEREAFRTPLRTQGLVLTTYHSVLDLQDGGLLLAQAVADGLRGRDARWRSTQELAWALSALSPLIRAEPDRAWGLDLRLGDASVSAEEPSRWSLVGAAGVESLLLEAPADLPAGLFAVVDSHGQRKDGALPISAGLSVTRALRDEEGRALDPASLVVGQLVYVQLVLASPVGRTHNVALVERLPAGWEIENPALSGAELPPWAAELAGWSLEHRDLRDDRVAAFGTLGPKPVCLVYAARVVSAGSFTWPGALVEAMYEPQLRARTAPVPLVIAAAGAVGAP